MRKLAVAVMLVGASLGAQGSVRASAPWSDDIWFANGIDRDAFLRDELLPLLGRSQTVERAVTSIRRDGEVGFIYTNGVGEHVPLLIRGPDGELLDTLDLDEFRSDPTIVVALHQTNAEGGTEPCGDQASDQMAYGTFFARGGFVVVCPTLSFTGARQAADQWNTAALYVNEPGWSAMGKDVAEVRWLLDAFEASGFSPETVVLIGHSQGAIYSLYAAALDERIDVVVANAGYVDTELDPNPGRWSRESWYRGFREHPSGLDQLEVVAAIAPRCVRIASYSDDEILGATLPAPERLAGFQEHFPTIDWEAVEGPHAWPQRELDRSLEWTLDALERCPT